MKTYQKGQWIGIGLVFGIALGAAFGNVGIGVVVGLIIGAVVELSMKNKEDKK